MLKFSHLVPRVVVEDAQIEGGERRLLVVSGRLGRVQASVDRGALLEGERVEEEDGVLPGRPLVETGDVVFHLWIGKREWGVIKRSGDE